MSKGKLRGKLQTTIRFLKKSALDYDAGDEDEALRMAVSLRVLFHETQGRRPSIPLLKHLDYLDKEILTSADGRSLVCFIDQQIKTSYPPGVSAHPRLQKEFRVTKFDQWWAGEVVFHSKTKTKDFFRKDVILTAANQDGGAHVDLTLEEFYEEIASGKTLLGMNPGKLIYPGELRAKDEFIFANNIHLALIRQFTHEVLSTVTYYKW